MDLVAVLRAAGVPVAEEAGWRTRTRPGVFHPSGIVVHDDVIPRAVSNTARVRVIRDGRSDLPGPLAHVSLLPDGTWHVVASGRCNHAGEGGGLLGFPVGSDGNANFYGVEVAHHPDDGGYDPRQIPSLVRGCAALCRAGEWGAERVLHHREWAPKRKIDMEYRGPLRLSIAFELSHPEPKSKESLLMAVSLNDDDARRAQVREWFHQFLGRGPSSIDEMNLHVLVLTADGADRCLTNIVDSEEGQTFARGRRAAYSK